MTSAWCCCIKGLGTLSEVAEALFCIKYRYQRGGVLNSYLTIRVNPGHPWLSLWFRLCRAGIFVIFCGNSRVLQSPPEARNSKQIQIPNSPMLETSRCALVLVISRFVL